METVSAIFQSPTGLEIRNNGCASQDCSERYNSELIQVFGWALFVVAVGTMYAGIQCFCYAGNGRGQISRLAIFCLGVVLGIFGGLLVQPY